MAIEITINWLISIRPSAKNDFENKLKASCSNAFRRTEIAKLTLYVIDYRGQNSNSGQTVRIAPDHLVMRNTLRSGVPVFVQSTGKKYVLCYLVVEGMAAEKLRDVITMGPLSYTKPSIEATPDTTPIDVEGQLSGDSADSQDNTQFASKASKTSNEGRMSDDPHELLRFFWETTIQECASQIEGEYLILTNEELSIRAARDLSIELTHGNRISFYKGSVAPFGKPVVISSRKSWKLDIRLINAFVSGGPLSSKKCNVDRKKPTLKKAPVPTNREPDAVLNELEDLLRRIEVASHLQSEQSHLKMDQGVNEDKLKEFDAQIASAEQTLAELREKRSALKQVHKANTVRLEEIEALLARNAVSEETKRRLQAIGVLKRDIGNDTPVVKLVAQSGKS